MEALRQLRSLLKFAYGFYFIIFGSDKFLNILANWPKYISELAPSSNINSDVYTYTCGIVEIIIGLLILLRPVTGACAAIVWLVLLAIMLIAVGHHVDMAARNIVIGVGIFAFIQLTFIIRNEEKAVG